MNLYVLTNQTSSISSWHFLSDLPQGALKLSQEVRFFWSAAFAVDVVHFKPEFLHRLEVVVEDDALGKLRIQAVLDFLRSPNLTQETVKKKKKWKESCVALQVQIFSASNATKNRNSWALTSYQWGPDEFKWSTHMGSDLEKVSMSSRLSQAMLSATLVTQSAALCCGAPNDAIAVWGKPSRIPPKKQTKNHTCQKIKTNI